MLNFFFIVVLFVLIIILFGSLSGLKARVRLLEYLLAEKRKTNAAKLPKKEEITEVKTERFVQQEREESDPWQKSQTTIKDSKYSSKTASPSPFRKVCAFFTGGNSIVRIGMVVFFIGIAFLLKYAADSGLFPISIRLISVAILAVALFTLGFFLEKKRLNYAITLEGGALAILYLLSFTSFYHYKVIEAGFTFACLVLITAITILWAIKRDVKALAIMGIIGGFIAPLLIKTSTPNVILLFSYYLILNIGIFITAWLRRWRELNVLGFIFTFVITALWYYGDYTHQDFYTAELFLFIFFAFYLIIAILSALKQPPNLKGFIEGSLVFALPAVVFALQAHLFDFRLEPLAFIAIILGALYLCLGLLLHFYKDKAQQPLSYAFAAIAVIFFTAAIPLLLSGEWTSAIWALEGAALIWVGIKQSRYLMHLGGMLIAILANLYFYIHAPVISYSDWFSNQILDSFLLTLTNLLAAYFLYSAKDAIKPWEYSMGKVLFAIGALWLWAFIYYSVKLYGVENTPYEPLWAHYSWALIPSLVLLLTYFSRKLVSNTFTQFIEDYSKTPSWILVVYLFAWVLIANLQMPSFNLSWSYWLLLNPLDLVSLLVLITLGLHLFHGKHALINTSKIDFQLPAYALAIITFIWLNSAILRFLHFDYNVPFTMDGILHSQLTQVTLSLFWGIIALVTTVLANKQCWRPLWFVGAVMIGITILKLFLIDLSNSGTLERIIAFISIGAILLVIGYFSPLPPKKDVN